MNISLCDLGFVACVVAEAEVGPGWRRVPSLRRHWSESIPSLQMQKPFFIFASFWAQLRRWLLFSLIDTSCQALGFKPVCNSLWKAPCVLLSIIVHLRTDTAGPEPQGSPEEARSHPLPLPQTPLPPTGFSELQPGPSVVSVSVESWSKEKVLLARSLKE